MTLVLLSGGIDSAVLASRESASHALLVDYGQRHLVEFSCARTLCCAMGIGWSEIRIRIGESPLTSDTALPLRTLDEILRDPSPAYVPGRNAILLSLAVSEAQRLGLDRVIYGANADDQHGFSDCTPSFTASFSQMAESTYGIRVEAPFSNSTKAQIVDLGIALGVPFHHTWTCYTPVERERKSGHAVLDTEYVHCGRCDACQLRKLAFERAGFKDSIEYAS